MPYLVKDKIGFLSEASKILSSSLDYNATLTILAKMITTSVGDFCIIDIMEEGKMERLAVGVSDLTKSILAQKFAKFRPDPTNKLAIYDAAKLGKPILISGVTQEWLETVTKIPEERDTVEKLGLKSMIFAPLKSRDKVIGVLTIGSSKENFEYTKDDTLFIEELASRAGNAVDKAKLFKEAQDAIKLRDEFISIASHELKTPLTSILLNLQLIQGKLKKATKEEIDMSAIEKLIEINITQGKRLSKLINDLLNTTVISSGKLSIENEKVDLKKLISEVLEKHNTQLSKNKITVTYKSTDQIIGNWDLVRIEQVLSNLISNAIKYGNKKPIKIIAYRASDKAIIKISDRGIGIDTSDQPYVFDLFRRAVDSNDYKGLGVGLFISRQIIEAHGGSLTLQSTLRKGTTFTIELPLEV